MQFHVGIGNGRNGLDVLDAVGPRDLLKVRGGHLSHEPRDDGLDGPGLFLNQRVDHRIGFRLGCLIGRLVNVCPGVIHTGIAVIDTVMWKGRWWRWKYMLLLLVGWTTSIV